VGRRRRAARSIANRPDVRILNMVPPEAMPYKSATHKLYDQPATIPNAPNGGARCGRAFRDSHPASRGARNRDGRLIGFGMGELPLEQSAPWPRRELGGARGAARSVFGYEARPLGPPSRLTAKPYPVRRDPEPWPRGLETNALPRVANQGGLGSPSRTVIRSGMATVRCRPTGWATFASRQHDDVRAGAVFGGPASSWPRKLRASARICWQAAEKNPVRPWRTAKVYFG